MIAFVLSGGANRGPIEAGALQSLVAHNIKPDMVVGTSAGALNGAYFCAHPDAASVDINIPALSDLSLFDFSKARELIAAGKAALDAYLGAPKPNTIQSIAAAQAAAQKPPRGGQFMKWRRR